MAQRSREGLIRAYGTLFREALADARKAVDNAVYHWDDGEAAVAFSHLRSALSLHGRAEGYLRALDFLEVGDEREWDQVYDTEERIERIYRAFKRTIEESPGPPYSARS